MPLKGGIITMNKALQRPARPLPDNEREYLLKRIELIEQALEHAPEYELDGVWADLNELSLRYENLTKE